MMWNFLVSALVTEASIVLYDGSPGHPDLTRLWDLAAGAKVSCFGTSASFVSACMKAGVEPTEGRDLSQLRAIGSTGSPLPPEGFRWIYDHVGEVWLYSTSGGTDVCTSFVGAIPTEPVYEGELQGRALGASVEAWDPEGRPLVGEVGELVVTQPMPSMPISFWGDDPQSSRYRESYFEMYPGIWRHGDWIEITERGTAIIYGRSDATINRGGIRMGTSEIYRAVLGCDAVVDAVVVDVPREGTDGWMPLFVVLRGGSVLDETLKDEITQRVRTHCSPRHAPDEIVQITEVPRTLSGKILEVPIKRVLSGAAPEAVVSRESLANPAAFDAFVQSARNAGC
jgi:acetoacetyl-CoA synthetase